MKLLVYVVLSLFGVGCITAGPVGQDPCTWGPSFWCSSLHSAYRCQSISHCINDVWKHSNPNLDLTQSCKYGRKMIYTMRRDTKSSEKSSQMFDQVSALCKLIKDDKSRRKCKKQVMKNYSEIIQLINSDIPLDQVSALLHVCSSEPALEKNQVDNVPPTSAVNSPSYQVTNETMCQDCKKFISDIKTQINKPGIEAQFLAAVKGIVCPKLGDIETVNVETVCGLGLFCVDTITNKPKWVYQAEHIKSAITALMQQEDMAKEKITCSDCKKVMTSSLTFYKDTPLRSGLQEMFSYLCAHTTLSEQQCSKLSKSWFKQELFDNLLHDFDSEEACKSLLSCQPDPHDNLIATPNNQVLPTLSSEEKCTNCIDFFTGVSDILYKNMSIAEVGDILRTLWCQQTGSLKLPCNALVDKALPAVFQYLTTNPHNLCSNMKMCGSSPGLKSPFNWKQAFNLAQQKTSFYDLKCDECRNLVNVVRDADRDPKVQKAVREAAFEACIKIGYTHHKCSNLVQQYVPQLFEFIASEMDPEVVCSVLLSCSEPELQHDEPPHVASLPETVEVRLDKPGSIDGVENSRMAELQKAVDDITVGESVECAICRLSMEFIDQVIADNRTESNVEDGLKNLCNILPSTVKEPCDEFIQKYTPVLTEFLLQELDPALICDEVVPSCNETDSLPSTVLQTADRLVLKKNEKSEATLECQLCQLVVNTVDTLLKQNQSQTEIKDLLEGVCKRLPQGIQSQCQSFVDEYYTTVVQMLVQQLDPQAICVTINMCAPSTYKFVPSAVQASNFTCEVCEVFFQWVDLLIVDNSSQAAMRDVLEVVCQILPFEINRECVAFVKNYEADILNLLVQEVKPKVMCHQLMSCNETVTQHRQQLKPVPSAVQASNFTCEVCEVFFQWVDLLIVDNSSQDAMTGVLEVVCQILPLEIGGECVKFVQKYEADIVNLLVQKVKPKAMCHQLMSCNATVTQRRQQVKPVPRAVQASNFTCEVCEVFFQWVDLIIVDNSSQAAMRDVLEVVCQILPFEINRECVAFVKNYEADILNLLVQEVKPKAMCHQLMSCNETVTQRRQQIAQKLEKTEVKAGKFCVVCDIIMGEIDTRVGNNKTLAALEKVLDEVCFMFPGNYSLECTGLVQIYGPAIINLVMQEIQPWQVCAELNLCTNTSKVLVQVPSPSIEENVIKGPEECALCKIIMQAIDNIILNNRTEAAIIHAIETVCDTVSGDLRLECKSEVDNYGPAVLDLLIHMADPSTVCSTLSICPTSHVSNQLQNMGQAMKSESEVCVMCRTALNFVLQGLKEQGAAQAIETLVEKVCSIFPSKLQNQCKAAVEEEIPTLLQMIADGESTLSICQKIDLCADPVTMEENDTQLGEDPCTYGPSYWCNSVETARQCGVYEECVGKYGLKP